MDLDKLKKSLGWESPICVAVFFIGAGILMYLAALALKIIVSL